MSDDAAEARPGGARRPRPGRAGADASGTAGRAADPSSATPGAVPRPGDPRSATPDTGGSHSPAPRADDPPPAAPRARPRAGDRPPAAASARRVALDVIRAVHADDAYANLLLPARIARARLSAADAGLATELTYGTLRMQGYYDVIIGIAARRDPTRIDAPVLDVLRLAAHQLLGMRVPAHAAVDEAVELTRAIGARSASGFVNGVLRTITRTDAAAWRERALATAGTGLESRAIGTSHPSWVVEAFTRALDADGRLPGGDTAELDALLAADNDAPRVALVALPGLEGVAELVAASGGVRAPYSPVAVREVAGDPAAIDAVRGGTARVQDEGSQLAALALSRVRAVEPGERWLDLCAGPGGKAALLAAEARLGGARLTANELVPARAGLVERALTAAFGADAPEVTTGDGTLVGAAEPGRYDRVLLDAPCTGLGALRRRPEARWRKRPGDVAELADVQSRLLDSAIAATRPGGVIAYVTCSPHPDETVAVVENALARHGDAIALIDTPEVLRAISRETIDVRGATNAQLWPHAHGTDAMFIQLIARVER
ncbi:transcription antitermination factor NusB [Galbitalea sp. SE-J8]|uniref:RsmB/NOP family class I SAM-dependent RNA methyltransferase n=1 Tax=Galbitalea sp. SE-J8 TaxID=3054952 RepID=UPI00259D2041|nr:transcription antitermination factor NusB [Galbitalea sp. SE-J8]MDM4764037.1 transcription antitermination factor NusB [Galbitalea sp. SE-J8]